MKLKRLPKSEERVGQYSTYAKAAHEAARLRREIGGVPKVKVVKTSVVRWDKGNNRYTRYECYSPQVQPKR